MSEIFYKLAEHLTYTKFHLPIFRIILMSRRAEMYAKSVFVKGAPLSNCVGFIDGTKIKIARPTRAEGACYSGHRILHCLKFQTVSTPDGLPFHLFGPLEGRRHDMTLHRRSGIDDMLSTRLSIDFVQCCIFGDPAYVHRAWVQVRYKCINITPAQAQFNLIMSSVRESCPTGL